MNIAIVGAGIIGVTTAYELACDGHAVTVFERHGAVAEESSFANAGVISPADVARWAAPGMPRKAAGRLFSAQAPIQLSWPLAWHELRWLAAFRRAGRPEVYLANRARLQRLAFYSRQRLHDLTEALQLNYDRSPGYLVLLRSEKERKQALAGLPLLQEAGVRFREITPEGARAVEPALNPDAALVSALHLPDDGVANCRQFAVLLKKAAQERGAVFEFNSAVAPLEAAAPTALTVRAADGAPVQRRFDAVVVCGGADSAILMRRLGLRLPLAKVHGYSVSAPIGEPLNAPRSAVMDERYKVMISRLGQRVRISGGAEIGGRPGARNPAAINVLYKALQDWFPGAARRSGCGAAVQEWKGARPMLPDGPPVLGASAAPGVWLNLGHGSSGWALACGSARVMADLVAGRDAGIDLEGLGIERLRA